MTEILSVMKWPLVACLLLPPLLVYFGLHIIRRGVIFVDLALAQVAALGATCAVLFGAEPGSVGSYAVSLAFCFFGAVLFNYQPRTPAGLPLTRTSTRPDEPPPRDEATLQSSSSIVAALPVAARLSTSAIRSASVSSFFTSASAIASR